MDLAGILAQLGQGPIGTTLSGMHQPIADNRMALMGLGAGLMSGPMSTAMPDAMKNIMTGALVDEKSRAAKMAEMEKERLRLAQLQMAKSLGLDPVFADSPSVLNAVAADRFRSKDAPAPTAFDRLKAEMTPEEWRSYIKKQAGLGEDKEPMTPNIIEYEYAKKQGETRPFPEWVASKGKGAGGTALTATDKKAIQESDESVAAAETVIGNLTEAKKLSATALSGPLASVRGQAGSVASAAVGYPNPAAQATSELENLTGLNAVENLKAVFGGQPTEGERKILMDLQGSVSQPDAVRQKIYDRAIALAEKRLRFNRDRAAEMRGGTYYSPGGGSPTAPADPFAGVTIRQVR